ncbi:hypothetical protein [Streptomyces sp. NPDC047028]|uniref:hypothetical protein n=1 Tax=Streptomyces sp. NPDC047028 TaxID=3155793 RepID=UPI0033C7AB24
MEPVTEPPPPAPRPASPECRTLRHPATDRRRAIEDWLLSTHPAPGRARREWQEYKVALVPLGKLFAAVRIPGQVLHGLAGSAEWGEVDAFLDDVLDGGAAICDPHGPRYYVLVPAGMPAAWGQAAEAWRTVLGACVLGRDTYLGVPRVTEVDFTPRACVSYWAVPMTSPAALCAPLGVARLLTDAWKARVDPEF